MQINPVERPEPPRTAREIASRMNEVSFNAVLLKELRMIAVLRQVVDPGSGEGARWAEMRVHRIHSEMMAELGDSSKLNAEWAFLTMLRDEGRRAPTPSAAGTAPTSACARPSTSTACPRASELAADSRAARAFLVAGLVFFTAAVLHLGAPVIVPVVEALVVWFVLNAMANGLRRMPLLGARALVGGAPPVGGRRAGARRCSWC